jgi:nucleoside-diphosphate-sugar epimerase
VILLPLLVGYSLALTAGLSLKGVRSRTAIAGPVPAAPPRKVLIVGATGGTGRHLLEQALARDLEVTALVRDPRALTLNHPRLRVVVGDVLDPAAVDEAASGQDAVLCALGHRRFFPPSRVLSEGTRNLLRAMEGHGVRRFVGVTSLGLGDSAGRLGLAYTLVVIPFVLPFYFWDKARQERLIEAGRTAWVIVRPGGLTDGPGRGAPRAGRGVGSFFETVRVPRADVAAFMLDQLTDDAWLGAAVGIGRS